MTTLHQFFMPSGGCKGCFVGRVDGVPIIFEFVHRVLLERLAVANRMHHDSHQHLGSNWKLKNGEHGAVVAVPSKNSCQKRVLRLTTRQGSKWNADNSSEMTTTGMSGSSHVQMKWGISSKE